MAVKTSWSAGDVLTAADLTDTFAAKANLASPAFTGTPTAPTAAAGTNTTQIATTAFVQTAGGLVLVTPTSIANSGGSASASGGQVTFTGVNSISLNGVFTSTYNSYRVHVEQIASTGTTGRLRYRASGSDNTTSNYYNGAIGRDDGGTTRTQNAQGATSMGMTFFGNYQTSWAFDVINPQAAKNTSVTGTCHAAESTAQGLNCYWVLGGAFSNTTQFDGFTWFGDTGTITGTIRVYGYKSS